MTGHLNRDRLSRENKSRDESKRPKKTSHGWREAANAMLYHCTQ